MAVEFNSSSSGLCSEPLHKQLIRFICEQFSEGSRLALKKAAVCNNTCANV